MSSRSDAPFSFSEVRPYEVVGSLSELRGPNTGYSGLPIELAWGGRREFELDDRLRLCSRIQDRAGPKDLREVVNGRLLVMIWPQMRPARPVRALRERLLPQLRAAETAR